MFGLGSTELIVIGVLVLLLFGGKRLPELGRGLAGAINNFKQGTGENPELPENEKTRT